MHQHSQAIRLQQIKALGLAVGALAGGIGGDGLMGAALLGTFQIVREKYHSSMIVEHLTLLDPRVAARVQSGGSAYGGIVADPELRNRVIAMMQQ